MNWKVGFDPQSPTRSPHLNSLLSIPLMVSRLPHEHRIPASSKGRKLQPGIQDVFATKDPGTVIELFDAFTRPKTSAALGCEFYLDFDGSSDSIGLEFSQALQPAACLLADE